MLRQRTRVYTAPRHDSIPLAPTIITTMAPRSSHLRSLRRLGLILVTGKGGVGKTTVSTALARRLAEDGARVLLLEMDPRESAHRLLGLPPSGGEVLECGEGLYFQNLQPRRVIDRLVREQIRIGPIVRKVQASPIYEHFVAGCPGLEELVILGAALEQLEPPHARTTPFQVVVLDAPATGHGLALLAAPRLVSEVIEQGPFGRLAGELATFIGNPERCGVVAVTHAQDLAVQETLELCRSLEAEHGRRAELIVANGLYPALTSDASSSSPTARIWSQRRAANLQALERLAAAPAPVLQLPLLPIDDGPRLAAELARAL